MRVRIQAGGAIRGVLFVSLAVIAASVYSARTKTPLAEQLRARVFASHETVVGARIEPGASLDLFAEFAANVVEVKASAGAQVEAGAVLAVLENREISGLVDAARRRVEAASAHLRDDAGAGRESQRLDEQLRSAIRNRDSAAERLRAFSLKNAEQAVETERARAAEFRALAQKGLATDAEVVNQETREKAAARELEAAREHFSRLKQELEQAESHVRLSQMQPTASSNTSAQADYADAQAALAVAEERARRLIITAPARGTVLDLGIRPGDWVASGARVARIVDLASLTIAAPVTAVLAQRIKAGQPVSVLLPGTPAVRIKAAVSEVSLAPDPVQQAYMVRVAIANPDPRIVLVGLEAQVEFEHAGAL